MANAARFFVGLDERRKPSSADSTLVFRRFHVLAVGDAAVLESP